MSTENQLEIEVSGTSATKIICYACSKDQQTQPQKEGTPECPIVIRCVNVEGDEDRVNTYHVPIVLTQSETLKLEKTKTSSTGIRKKFGSLAGPSKSCYEPLSSQTRKSLPVNAAGYIDSSGIFELRKNLQEACKVSRQNSVVPQVSSFPIFIVL